MQVNNRLLDDLARLLTGAVGAAAGMKGEVETLLRERLRRLLDEAELVSREEFEAVKAVAARARAEQEALSARVAALEARLSGAGNGAGHAPFRKSTDAEPSPDRSTNR
jgi:BMFP domain-containing protein YqiC